VPAPAVVEGTVRCARQDDREMTRPFVDALTLADERIATSCVFIDGAPIPHPAAPKIPSDRMP
jgi:hypothetical protein